MLRVLVSTDGYFVGRWHHRHAGSQQMLRILCCVEDDFHRNTLDDLDVFGARLRSPGGRKAEACACRGGNALDLAFEFTSPYASTLIVADWRGALLSGLPEVRGNPTPYRVARVPSRADPLESTCPASADLR